MTSSLTSKTNDNRSPSNGNIKQLTFGGVRSRYSPHKMDGAATNGVPKSTG
jgi:hypothetical protein